MGLTISTSMQITDYNRRLLSIFSNADRSGLWKKMSAALREITDSMFENRGGMFGRETWPGIKPELYGEKRIGTDGKEYGLFSPNSNPLVASGEYKDSFAAIITTPKVLTWGTRFGKIPGETYRLADVIPYKNWKDKPKGRVWKYVRRYVMPDTQSEQFRKVAEKVHAAYIQSCLRQAKYQSILAGTGVFGIMANDARNRRGNGGVEE